VKRKNGQSLLKFFAGVCVVLFVIWACVVFGLGPRHVKSRLINDISTFWDGPVTVDGIDFGLFHPITAKRVILENKTGTPCLEAKGVTLLFKEWPSRDPQLTGIALGGLDVRIQFEEGAVDLPFKKTTASSSGPQASSDPLGSFTVDDLAVYVTNAKGASVVLDDLSFSAVSQQRGYDLSLKQRSASDSDNFSLSGDINSDDSQVNLSLGLTKDVKKSLATGILSLLELPLPVEFEGSLSADMTLTGTLADVGNIQPAGTVILTDCSVIKDQTVWVEKINTSVQIKGSDVHIEKLTADSFGGQIEGRLEASIKEKKLAQFQGHITGKDIQNSGVMQALTDTEKPSEGSLAFDYTFTAEEGNLHQMKGQGTISLEQVDYEMIPIVQKIIRTVSRHSSKAQKKSNAIASFEIERSTATFQQARLANDWVAIDALPGGTLDLETGRVDGYVIVAPIKQISEGLHAIPVVNLFAHFTDQLTCLRVQGIRSDVSNIKITKEPVRDVAKGTLDFFKGVARTGGDFIKGMADSPGVLSKGKEK
jgi:hypothetical protein